MNESLRRQGIQPAQVALSLVVGIGSLLVWILGPLALFLGLQVLRDSQAIDGSSRPRSIGLATMALGAVSTMLLLLGVAALIFLRLQSVSRRVDCSDNLRQIGLALNQFADNNNAFPPATKTPASLDPGERLSWYPDILPWLGEDPRRREVYQRVSSRVDSQHSWSAPENQAAREAVLRIFRCPNGPVDVRGVTHYVGMAGLGSRAAFLKREDLQAGMFGHDRGVRRSDVTAGISFTQMVGETSRENGCWLAGDHPTVRGLDPTINSYSGRDCPLGGLHDGFVLMLWVDGSVRPLSDQAAPSLFRETVTIRR